MENKVIIWIGDDVSVRGRALLVSEVQVPVHADTEDAPATESRHKQILIPGLSILREVWS